MTDDQRIGLSYCKNMSAGDTIVLAAESAFPLLLRNREADASYLGLVVISSPSSQHTTDRGPRQIWKENESRQTTMQQMFKPLVVGEQEGKFSNYLVARSGMRNHVSNVMRGTEWPVDADGDFLGRLKDIVVV